MNEGQFTLEIWKNHLTKLLVKRLGCWQVEADDERLQQSGSYNVDSDARGCWYCRFASSSESEDSIVPFDFLLPYQWSLT